MTHCASCSSNEVLPLLDFGLQPICNRFLKSPGDPEELFPLDLSICNFCGLITITKPISPKKLQPRVDWIQYQEPEAHLDDFVDQFLTKEKSLPASASIFGLSRHDQPVLDRLYAKKFQNSILLSPDRGIETIQSLITPAWAEHYLHDHKKQDVVIARYILEHTQNITSFLKAIRMILSPEGHVIFEVPDFSPSLSSFEYSNLWEEHAFYFTPATFKRILTNHGFVIKNFSIYPSPLENVMSATCQLAPPGQVELIDTADLLAVTKAKNYAAQFQHRRKQLHQYLKQLRQSGEIAIFGAGHLAIKFINLFNLSEFISFVVDDHPKKCGCYLPGSHLSIKPTAALLNENIRYCLLSINPEREDQFLEKMTPFFKEKKILTYSIFSTSHKTLPLES